MSMISLSQKGSFNGDKKHLIHFLVPVERIFLKAVVPLVPAGIGTAHLTLMTIAWSAAVLTAGYLSRFNLHWLWLFNAAILLQYATDMLDGEVGRMRGSGLVKWGFYMDHFLDYVFLCSIVIGYSFLLPSKDSWLCLCGLAVTAGYMVHTFMDFTITNNFKISCNQFGVSEMRCVLVLFNIVLMASGKDLLIHIYPFVVAFAFLGLGVLVFNSQKVYRHLDTLQQAKQGDVP